jgi:dethiobiotin synthetase
MAGVFVTATDTGVGKTVVSALLIRGMRRRGVRVAAMKPAETGCRRVEGQLLPQDGRFLRDMAEMDEPLDLVVPERFALPLAPLVAGRLERRSVDLQRVIGAFETLRAAYDVVVVEGAGGLLVPFTERDGMAYYIADLVHDLGLPLLVVARPGLGTLNHTLLTVREAIRGGISVKGVVINYAREAAHDLAEKTNAAVMDELSHVPILGVVPHLQRICKETLDEASSCLDLDKVMSP